jgi:hypothetical protein
VLFGNIVFIINDEIEHDFQRNHGLKLFHGNLIFKFETTFCLNYVCVSASFGNMTK